MVTFFKKILAMLAIGVLVFPFDADRIEAAPATLSKTVEYFIGQESAVKANEEYAGPFSFTINIPESSLEVKSAIIEVNAISYNESGDQTITIDLEKNNDAPGTNPAYVVGHILDHSAKPKSLKLQYNALDDAVKSGIGPMSGILSGTPATFALYVKDTVLIGTAVSFSVTSAKLILTYDSSSSGSSRLKETKFFIVQEKSSKASTSEVIKNITLSLPEKTPEIQSVFIEIGGIAKGNVSNGVIGAKLISLDPALDPGYSSYTLDLNSSFCGGSCTTPFLVRYDASGIVSDFQGNKDYTFYARGTGFSVDLWSAKIIITYKYSVNTGAFPAKGELISSTFDTGVAQGAAYNSLLWKGSLNGGSLGQVGLQIAASNSITGPWLFEGPDCTSGTRYSPDADTPIPIETDCALSHNNKQYFRYKVIICSDFDCMTSGSINPRVDEVVVNWSR
jgi:hypothetical protein